MSNQTSTGSGEAHAVAGPFTLRETVLLGGALLLLVGSVLPFQVSSTVFANLWIFPGTLFHLGVTLILPLAVAGGFVWRRLVGRPVVRVGSLALDQLGSVSAVLSVAYFFFAVVGSLNGAYLLGLFGALAFLAATTLAPFIPAFSADFESTGGHLLTRPVRPVALKTAAAPAFPKPGPVPAAAAAPGKDSGQPAGAFERAESPASTLAATPAGASAAPTAERLERPEPSAAAGGTGRAGQERPGAAFAATGVLPAAAARADAAPERSDRAEPAERAQQAGHTAPAGHAAPAGHTAPAEHTKPAEQQPSGTAVPETGVVPAAAPATSPVHTVERSDRAGHAGHERSGEAASVAGSAAAAPTATAAPAATAEDDDEPFAASLREEDPATHQAFWFAVPQTRHALDEGTGAVAFTLQPGAWILALEDRGHEFLVQDTDGRLGVLRDLAHVERA